MIIFVIVTISATLAVALIYMSIRTEARRQDLQQKSRANRSLSNRLK